MRKILVCCSLGLLCSSVLLAAPHKRISLPKHAASHKMSLQKRQVVVVNRSNAEALASLKGLGIKRAQAVVDYRNEHGPFKKLTDLVNVKGIGSKLLVRIQSNNAGRVRLN